MVVKADQEKIKTLIKDTITLLCRNGLTFKTEFSIEALIGITLDKDDVFLVNINEIIRTELGDKLAAAADRLDEESVGDAEAWNEGSGYDSPQHERPPSGSKRRRKRRRSAGSPKDGDISNTDSSSQSEPPPKKEATSLRKNIKYENDDSNDLVFVKQEVDNDWNSRTFSEHNRSGKSSHEQENLDFLQGASLVPVGSQDGSTGAGSSDVGTPRSGAGTNNSQNMQHRRGSQKKITNGGPASVSMVTWPEHYPRDYVTDGNPPVSYMTSNQRALQEGSEHEDLSQFMASLDSPQNNSCLGFVGAHKSPKTLKQCNLCNKTFTSQYGYQTHMKMHQGIHPYKCDICGKGMASKTNLDEHMRHHTGQLLECEHCQKGFITTRAFKSHKGTCAAIHNVTT